MKILILMGSPRLHGNTAELCIPFAEELKSNGAEVRCITLADKNIASCKGCYACQNVQGKYGCVQHDDMTVIAEDILWADCIVLATPIYAWYCTAPMKALLDRHYGFNKYYGSIEACLWAGKSVAILATHGYEREYAVSPFETGVKRLCTHSNLNYVGLYSVRDENDIESFRTQEAVNGAKKFALKVIERTENYTIKTSAISQEQPL